MDAKACLTGPCGLAFILLLALALPPELTAFAGAATPTPPADAPATFRQQAIERFAAGDYSAARELFDRARAAYVAVGDRDGEGRMLFNLAIVAQSQQDTPAVLAYLAAARQVFAALRDAGWEGKVVFNLAQTEAELGHVERAAALLDEALLLMREAGAAPGIARVLAEMAFLEDRRAQYDAGLAHGAEALALYQSVQDFPNAAVVARRMGVIHDRLGRYAAAAAAYAAARSAYALANDPANAAEMVHLEAWARGLAGDLGAALAGLIDASDRYHVLENWDKAAAIETEIGDFYLAEANPSRAETYYGRAAATCAKGCTAGAKLAVQAAACDFYSHRDALAYAEAACAPLLAGSQAGVDATRAAALESLGDARRGAGAPAQALLAYGLAFAALPAGHAHRAHVEVKRGWVLHELGRPAEALAAAHRALARAGELQEPEARGVALARIANLFLGLGRTDLAQEHGEQARALFMQTGDLQGQVSALHLLARVAGPSEEALSLYQQAIERTEQLRTSARGDELRRGVAAAGQDVYREAVALAAALGRSREAFELAERGRARAFLDRLGGQSLAGGATPGSVAAGLLSDERALRQRLAFLDRTLAAAQARPAGAPGPSVASLQAELRAGRAAYTDVLARIAVTDPAAGERVAALPPSLAAIQEALAPHSGLLVYYVLADQVLAFVIGQEDFALVRLPVTETQLAAWVGQFRRFDALQPTPGSAELAALSAALLLPVADRLPRRVAIVPHGILHYVPFAALPLSDDPAAPRFGERHAVSAYPSAASVAYIRPKEPTGPALVVANAGVAGLAVLRHSGQEARAVAAILGVQPLMGAAATETTVRERAPEAALIHIAAHGRLLADTPLFSSLALAADGVQDGNLEVHEVYGLRLSRAPLVVLSACDTQPGLVDAGDDVVALNRAFLAAGASAVLASLWSVDDAATAALMAHFYRNLAAGMGQAQALAAAQARVRTDPDHPAWRHPYYWAAFVLTGDPGVTLPATDRPPTRTAWWPWLGGGLVLLLVAAGLSLGWWAKRQKHAR